MFHVILQGWIETDDKDFAKKLEDFIIKSDSKHIGKTNIYEISTISKIDSKDD